MTDDIYEREDGDTFTLNALVYMKVRQGIVAKEGDDFIVDGTRYTRIHSEGEP